MSLIAPHRFPYELFLLPKNLQRVVAQFDYEGEKLRALVRACIAGIEYLRTANTSGLCCLGLYCLNLFFQG
jgi:hypothetical protein